MIINTPSTAPIGNHPSCPVLARRLGTVAAQLGALLVVLAMVIPHAANAETTDDAARRAAQEIQSARDRANAAAEAYFQAQSDLDILQDDIVRLERETSQLIANVDQLERNVEAIALARFVNSGADGIPLLTGLQAPKDQVQAEVFAEVLTNNGSSTLDEYDLAQKDLVANQEELSQRREQIEQQQEEFTELQAAAEAEVERLRKIEEERLTDEAVVRALQAQQAAALARFQDQIRRDAEAAAKALPNPGLSQPQANPSTSDPVPANPAATVVTINPNAGASGGSSGGRTGRSGTGSIPRGMDSGAGYIDNIMCPIPGSAYGDSWGAPRSGGRRHEGVDMIAPRDVPIVAVVNGVVTFKQNNLGGNAASLAGDNGNRYYYAHFARYEGTSRRVAQGDVIGYNGDSGNAAGTNHLHFQVHPGGALPVNPTPSVRTAGC